MTKNDRKALESALVEVLFVLLPLVVLTIVIFYKGHSWSAVFESAEWSFAAAVFIGQSIVKVVQGVTGHRLRKVNTERIGLIVALLIVIGLVPALTVLGLILVKEPPPQLLIHLQLALFLGSIVTFVVLAFSSKRMLLEQEPRE